MTTPIVHAEGVVKHFGEVKALDGVDIAFEAGIIYGLLGPNGAGKTTLIRVLTTLMRPDAGSATVAGIDVLRDPVGARTRLGLAGQFAAVDDYLTGRENVEMVGRLYHLSVADSRTRAAEILERIGLIEAADRPVRTYSGGMRRRLDLAASIVGRPSVLFLDEPTTGIDPGSRIDVWDLISDLVAGGTTILLTTQYLDEADQLAARVGVIDNGKVIAEGTPSQLKDTLGGSVVELTVADADRAKTLTALDSVNEYEPAFEPSSKKISLAAPNGPLTLTKVVRVLDEQDVAPEDIALRQPTLDDVFLSITGHAAEEETTETTEGTGRRGRRARRSR